MELKRQFMKNIIMILYTELSISMYPLLLLITEKSGIINKQILMFDWQKAFKNKNTNEMTRILTDTSMNIFKNFILHKTKKVTVNILNR